MGVLAWAALSVPASAVASESDAELLERYRPILRYDGEEEHFAQPISRTAEVIDRDLVYGHLAAEGDDTWLQYWLFYAYNSQDRGLVATGRHDGDWEFMQLRLGPGDIPDRATFAQHSTAESCAPEELTTERVAGADVPAVFVANGSHASYPRPGSADRPWPDPNDDADGSAEVRPGLELIDDGAPAWVDDPDPWGSSRAGWVPGEQSSPPGPRFQADGRWDRPSTYDETARPCGSDPPGRPWQAPLMAAALALPLALILVRRRRAKGPGS